MGCAFDRWASASVLLLVFATPAGLAREPLYAKNLSPVSGLLGLPSQRGALTQGRGSLAVALHGSIANHYIAENRSNETITLDGETGRLAVEVRYGLADNWDLQLELPWLKQSGGNLDSLIDSWHDTWGMSDGGRSNTGQDLLNYRYSGTGSAFEFDDDASGLGDTSLMLNYAFYRRQNASAGLSLGYKFATGEERDFLGSGADDSWLALRFSADDLAALPLTWHAQLGYLRAGSSDLLGDRQERDLWFAGLSLDWSIAQNWSLLAQVDSHSAPMESDLTAVGDTAVMLTLGGRWRFAPGWSVDLSLVEDVAVETAPDVTFQASLRYRGD